MSEKEKRPLTIREPWLVGELGEGAKAKVSAVGECEYAEYACG